MSTLPTGTVTFLFTDIEGSTRLWQEKPQAMAVSHARHDAILREAIESNQGHIFQMVGDAFCAAFPNAATGLQAALAVQRGLLAEPWGDTGAIRVRMGLHTGAAEIAANGSNNYTDGYATLAAAQRVMSAAHGGQVLLSQTTHDLLQNDLPQGVTLRNLGEHRLKDLRSPLRLYQLVAPGLPQDFSPIQSLNSLPNNLPVQLTSFIGREKEIAEIQGLLGAARLVTLTGPGGTGKTRLALEVSVQELAHYTHGVWFIELAPLSDPSQIMPALVQVFGLQALPDAPLETLVADYLRDKKTLLIFDNCEHLIEACARLADDLLHQCKELKIIASSREALGIAGEVAYRTPSLAEAESTQLFVERARAANSQFSPTESNAAPIAQICRRLDGIPLAIELAAARVRLLSPEQIAARLDDRFRLLVGGSRTALPRQQTLRAMIDWSYHLLSEEEKQLLQSAAVFVGGWTLEAIEAVSGDPDALDHLDQLVNKSLVVTEETGGGMRYSMLETIRQYAREKLFDAGQMEQRRDLHFTYFDGYSEFFWWEETNATDLVIWKSGLENELDNFRAALEWGFEHHPEEAIHLATNTSRFVGWLGNQAEARMLVKTALETYDKLPPVSGEALLHRQQMRVRALWVSATTEIGAGDNQTALLQLKEAIAFLRQGSDQSTLGKNLLMYALASSFTGANDGFAEAQEGMAILQEVGDKAGITIGHLIVSRIMMERGDLAEWQNHMDKALKGLQSINSSYLSAMSVMGLGIIERLSGRYETAQKYFEAGLVIFEGLHNRHFIIVMHSELGHIARQKGDLARALDIYKQTIIDWQDIGSRGAIAHELECFAFIAAAQQQPERAARLLAAAEALRELIGSPMRDYERTEYDPIVARLHSQLGDAAFDAQWAYGRAMTMEQAIQFAVN